MFDDLEKLPLILQKYTPKKILCFCGKNSFENIKNRVDFSLFLVEIYNNFSNNPKENELKEAFLKLDKNYDLILAIGGGSVIDFAKLYKFYLFESNKKLLPLIAVPTTAGTGSEATSFAVLYKNSVKHSIDYEYLLPDDFLIDYTLLFSLSKYQKACTAFDAFAQAIEAFWCINANDKSDEFAIKSINLCQKNLISFVNQIDRMNAKAMSEASHFAGKAINITRTTLPHALSYAFTSKYDLPHGHAVALSFAKTLDFHIKKGIKKSYELKKMGIDSKFIQNMLDLIGLEYRLDKLGIKNLDELIQKINPQRLKNNPIIPTQDETKELFYL